MASKQRLRERFTDGKRWNLILPRHQCDWLDAQCVSTQATRIQVLRTLIQAAIDAEADTGNR